MWATGSWVSSAPAHAVQNRRPHRALGASRRADTTTVGEACTLVGSTTHDMYSSWPQKYVFSIEEGKLDKCFDFISVILRQTLPLSSLTPAAPIHAGRWCFSLDQHRLRSILIMELNPPGPLKKCNPHAFALTTYHETHVLETVLVRWFGRWVFWYRRHAHTTLKKHCWSAPGGCTK